MDRNNKNKSELLYRLLINVNDKLASSLEAKEDHKLSSLLEEREKILKEITRESLRAGDHQVEQLKKSFKTIIEKAEAFKVSTEDEMKKVKKARKLTKKYQLGSRND